MKKGWRYFISVIIKIKIQKQYPEKEIKEVDPIWINFLKNKNIF